MGDSKGQQFIGRYELKRALGKGSQGAVYLAKDPNLDRHVAIKILITTQQGLRNEGPTGAPLEAVIASKLSHPNIVPIYDAGECNAGPYLIFEYVRGETLANLLRTKGGYSVADAVSVMLAILDAMAAAHSAGILHLDLNPRNILIDEHGTPRVMDFGLSQFVSAMTEERRVTAGTLRYMAPEHFLDTPLGPWTDVFALGSTFFELVTGTRLMQGRSIDEIRQRIVSEPADLEALRSDPHAAAFGHFLLGAVHKNPDGRYSDCSAMSEALQMFLQEAQLATQRSNAAQHSTIEFLMRRMQRKKDFPTISSTLADINRLAADDANATADQPR